ncbi:type II 3-dehydroquinate dehydratase [Parageobacillus sp. G301]|nr:type II 3-dehydroquinate dehydratase [Parageobacillus sp. G301]
MANISALVVEVHISNIHACEPLRHWSVTVLILPLD